MTNSTLDFDGLIDEFVIESGEALDMAVDDVLTLEKKSDQGAIDRIFRVVHTIKGTAGMLGFNALSQFVHSLEDICSDIRSGDRKVDRQAADGLLKCLDHIQSKLDFIRDTRQEDENDLRDEECLRALQVRPAMRAVPASAKVETKPKGVFLNLEKDECTALTASNSLDELLGSAQCNKDCKALIVEDEFMTRSMLYSFLSKFMTCYVAKDGSEAIQAVTESYLGPDPKPFSLIVMDVMMPIINGLQATKAIRAMERAKGAALNHTEATILIATAVDDDKTRHEAIHECGADGYMIKPLGFKEMTELLVQHHALPPVPILEKQIA